MARIPFNRPTLTGNELAYIQDAVTSGRISGNGAYTRRCEALLERKFSARRVLLTTSCTDALELASLLIGFDAGDEVIVPSYTFVSTVNAFVLRGATPVFVEIRADTKNIDERLIEEKITRRTRAIFAVHYGGVGAEMDTINAIASRHGLIVVEDAAQGINASYRGRYLGTHGAFGCYSFHDTKNVTCGEGGALVINDPQYIDRAEVLREKGTDRLRFSRGEVDKYTWQDIGSSFVLSEVLAAFLLAQLEHLDEVTAARRRIYDRYADAFADLAQEGFVEMPVIPPDREGNFHMFPLVLRSQQQRDDLIRYLKDLDTIAIFHYVPLHSSPMGQRLGYRVGDLPLTEDISRRLVRLPLYNEMDTATQDVVIGQVRRYAQLARSATDRPPLVGESR